MHALIICGTPWCRLDSLLSQLQEAGVSAALPAQTGSIRTMEEWYARLFAHSPQPDQPIEPGTLWAQSISEIFLANWDQALWGWADHRSTWLLDFWLNFDPQTRFVLVHTPAVDVLAAAVLSSQRPDMDTNLVLERWCAYQEQMLQFYLRHRDRCVWLPNTYGQLARDERLALSKAGHREQRFVLPWPTPIEWVFAVSDQNNFSGSIAALVHQLAQRAVQQHDQALAIQSEILATIPGCDAAALPGPQLATVRDAAGLLDQIQHVAIREMASLRRECSEESRRRADLEDAFREQSEKYKYLQSRVEDQAREQAELQSRLRAETQAKSALERQCSTESQARKEIEEENELLLLQLHQVQEELENYFLKYQQAQKEGQTLHERLTRWSQRYPDDCEWNSLSVAPESGPQQQTIVIRQLHYGSRSLKQLTLQLDCNPRQINLVVKHAADDEAPLLHWPKETNASGRFIDAAEVVLPLLAESGTSRVSLDGLAPRDLRLLRAVCLNIADALPKDVVKADAWAQLWKHAATLLMQLPPAWRYDAVCLKSEQINPGYEHLWMAMENVEFGERRWPQFEFRLGAAEVVKKGFSYLPRLEFPFPENDAHKQFDGMFKGSEDDKGSKFEIRFDLNQPAIDVAAWDALTGEDKAAALALVRQLGALLQQLEQADSSIHRSWGDWQRLVSGIQTVLVTCLGIEPELVGHDTANTTAV